jgi:hypothetical protein
MIPMRRTDWMSWNEWGTKLPQLLAGGGGGRSSSLLADSDEGSVGEERYALKTAWALLSIWKYRSLHIGPKTSKAYKMSYHV